MCPRALRRTLPGAALEAAHAPLRQQHSASRHPCVVGPRGPANEIRSALLSLRSNMTLKATRSHTTAGAAQRAHSLAHTTLRQKDTPQNTKQNDNTTRRTRSAMHAGSAAHELVPTYACRCAPSPRRSYTPAPAPQHAHRRGWRETPAPARSSAAPPPAARSARLASTAATRTHTPAGAPDRPPHRPRGRGAPTSAPPGHTPATAVGRIQIAVREELAPRRLTLRPRSCPPRPCTAAASAPAARAWRPSSRGRWPPGRWPPACGSCWGWCS